MNYEFFIDKGNEDADILMCNMYFSDRSYKSRYYKDEATKKLIAIDNNRFKNFKIENNNIIMTDGFTTVKLINAEEFIKSGYIDFLEKQINKINRTIAKQNENGKVINKKVKGAAITVGLVATMLFTIGTQKQKDAENFKTSIEQEIDINNYNKLKEGNTINAVENLYTQEVTTKTQNEEIYNVKQSLVPSEKYINPIIEEEQKEIPTAQIIVESDDFTKNYAYERCADIVTPIAEKWGISPNIIIAQVTQESAARDMDNLLHVVPSNWMDHVFNQYDFEQNKYRKIVLTDNPDMYKSDVTTISREELKNPKTQIAFACSIDLYLRNLFNNNILAALLAYNQGYNGVMNFINKIADIEEIDPENILNNPELFYKLYEKHKSLLTIGDRDYINNVARYIDGKITFKYIDENNEIQETSIMIDTIDNTEEYSHGRSL